MNYFLNHGYKDLKYNNPKKRKSEQAKNIKSEPLVDSLKKMIGRPPRLTLEEIVWKFKEDIGSKEDLLANPKLLFNAELIKRAKGNKEHWFWVAKHLSRRIKGLNNCWYGKENSIVSFLLKQTGWFDKSEAIEMSYRLAFLAEKERRKKLGLKAKIRMANEERKKKLSKKIKEMWEKDEQYKEKCLNGILNRKKIKSSTALIKEKKLDLKDNLNKTELVYTYFLRNYEKLIDECKKIQNLIVKIDRDYKEWLLKRIDETKKEYCSLKPLMGIYILYCQKYKKLLFFDELEKIDFELTSLLRSLYQNEYVIFEELKEKEENIEIKIKKTS
ncbi:MAG: hypothetical protein ACK4J0_01545 [Candidatus Anstonellaceae archaeon]